jgi:hypothetical protein
MIGLNGSQKIITGVTYSPSKKVNIFQNNYNFSDLLDTPFVNNCPEFEAHLTTFPLINDAIVNLL